MAESFWVRHSTLTMSGCVPLVWVKTPRQYVIMSNGTTTFISGGTGGDVYIRAGANSSSCQIVLDSSDDDIDITGDVSISEV